MLIQLSGRSTLLFRVDNLSLDSANEPVGRLDPAGSRPTRWVGFGRVDEPEHRFDEGLQALRRKRFAVPDDPSKGRKLRHPRRAPCHERGVVFGEEALGDRGLETGLEVAGRNLVELPDERGVDELGLTDQPERSSMFRDAREEGAEGGSDPVTVAGMVRGGCPRGLSQLVAPATHQLSESVGLAGEVNVEGSQPDAGLLRDIDDRGVVEPESTEDLLGGFQQTKPGLLTPAATRTRGASDVTGRRPRQRTLPDKVEPDESLASLSIRWPTEARKGPCDTVAPAAPHGRAILRRPFRGGAIGSAADC